MKTIAFPHSPGKGGPGSFQTRFEKALIAQGWAVIYADAVEQPDVIMVVGGTKRLGWLWKMKRAGIPIVYRLDGINWLHRKTKVSARQYLLSEFRNFLSQAIRKYLADTIVYQSYFVEAWWQERGWATPTPYHIINNGVDTQEFTASHDAANDIHLLCLEGTLDYSPYAIELINKLSAALSGKLAVVAHGGFQSPASQHELAAHVNYKGKLNRHELSQVYRNAIYLSLDINAACPNTVVEALASGAPIVGFDTGALKELVGDKAGVIVDYGADPWSLQPPKADDLLEAIESVKANYDTYSQAARQRAEAHFNMDKVFDQYMAVVNAVMTNARTCE